MQHETFNLQQLERFGPDEGGGVPEARCGLKLVLEGIGVIEDLQADELSELKKVINRKPEAV